MLETTRGVFALVVVLTDSKEALHLPASHFLVRPSIASPTFLLYFQVNTVVGRFWIMLKISTWLVGRLLRFFLKKPLLPFVPLFTICITSPKTVYAIYSIYLIATL